MKVEIKIPSMGESVTEAKVSNIIKQSGSSVKEDEEILELETEKVNQVLFAPKSGVLTLQVSLDQTVTIGQVIGYVETEGAVQTAAAPPPPPEKRPASKESARQMVSDFASALKAEPAPVERPAPQQSVRKRMSGLRKVIAQRLVEAKNTTAMLTT